MARGPFTPGEFPDKREDGIGLLDVGEKPAALEEFQPDLRRILGELPPAAARVRRPAGGLPRLP
jgi:hypothetical protein